MTEILEKLGFKPKPKELVNICKDNLILISKHPKEVSDKESKAYKISLDIAKRLEQIKELLYGSENKEPEKAKVIEIAKEAVKDNLLSLLIENIKLLGFEARKDVNLIFNNLLKVLVDGRYITVDYVNSHSIILTLLLYGYEDEKLCIPFGSMLRECFEHEILAEKFLKMDPEMNFYKLFEYVDDINFSISSDAFVTFKLLLTKHKQLAADYIEKNFNVFFGKFFKLLLSKNFATKLQSITLLKELLLDRTNMNIMTKFIIIEDNLKLIMTLLLDPSENIQFEAFSIFKVFACNPNITNPIKTILIKNRDKLIRYLDGMKRTKDPQFDEEKQLIIDTINNLVVDQRKSLGTIQQQVQVHAQQHVLGQHQETSQTHQPVQESIQQSTQPVQQPVQQTIHQGEHRFQSQQQQSTQSNQAIPQNQSQIQPQHTTQK